MFKVIKTHFILQPVVFDLCVFFGLWYMQNSTCCVRISDGTTQPIPKHKILTVIVIEILVVVRVVSSAIQPFWR